ncbi:AtpZ/AtpI family protein [Sphingobium nicotianae]|uniref:ATP synthase protein I n=1 Tax=Sphingobium nicotianae TaxID=2782607 RepID=A0A9X1D8L9_9SPHN|nr:AtpZ/AtpI family protein [Sphingobium nicotianae]MBT2185839.1 AtpZ/AtpI family protein [Sphingobium nicotianae]
MAETEPGQDPIAKDSRIGSLEERLKRAEAVEQVRTNAGQTGGTDENTRLGNRVLAELIGGLVGGALIGFVLDKWIGTSPWLLLVFLFLGIFVAFRNIIRISTKRPEK